MRRTILLCGFLCLVSADPVVEGSLGTISGKINTILGIDIEAFLGIPYAKPPTGKLRFSLPQPFGAVGNLTATRYGSDCPQLPAFEIGRSSDDEDCLVLNVYRKSGTSKDDKKAVVAIVHGGGYSVGSAAEVPQNAKTLAGVGDVIIVSFNYRLGIFGFADMKELAPGNLGFHDQRLALQWIQDHIADFGGDPKKVTIMGVSAGAMSVSAQIITIADKKDLFQAAILDAGVVASHGSLEDSETSFMRVQKVAKAVRCSTDPDKMVDCLREVSVTALLSNSSSHTSSSDGRNFVATSDGVFLPHDVEDYVEKNPPELRKVRTIVGYAHDEGSMFADLADKKYDLSAVKTREDLVKYCGNVSELFSYPFNVSSEETRKKIGELYVDENPDSHFNAVSSFIADGVFRCPINKFIQSYSRHNDKVFAYQFDRKLNRTYFFVFDPETLGAFHFSPYLHFSGALLLDGGTVNEADKQFALDAMKTISHFCKTDEALAFRGVEWPSYSKSGEVFIFNETPSVEKKLGNERHCRELFSGKR